MNSKNSNNGIDVSRSAIFVSLFTDLVGSTAWKRVLLDQNYTRELLIPHDRLFRELLSEYDEAEERANTGDGFFATFKTASMATHFALRFHHALAENPWSQEILKQGKPTTRIGIHLGEIVEFSDVTGRKVSGQAIDLAARVMSLGEGGYTVVTRHAFDSGRQHVLSNPVDSSIPLIWVAYGRYRFKGSDDDPIEVFGVAPQGSPALKPPGDSEKAKRVNENDDVGSWRPASGQMIPNRQNWCLEKQLGEGGFGEVWLGKNSRTKELRVFKFCFDIDRLRSFKRELALFRLLQSQFGNRPDFVRLIDVQFDEPPYCIESEYIAAGNLLDWLSSNELTNWPVDDRIRFVADLADSVGAAHSLNIVHKDLKPSNVLIRIVDGKPKPVIADFGIGVLTDQSMLAKHNITVTGNMNTLLGNESSRTGTRVYSPPEAMFGSPAVAASDVYALGVILYQLLIGDLQQALGTGWEENIVAGGTAHAKVLMGDIREATRIDPKLRLQSVKEFANRLRTVKQRAKLQNLKRNGAAIFMLTSVAALATSVLAVCGAFMLLVQGPLTSIDNFYSTWLQLWFAASLVLIPSIFGLLLSVRFWLQQPIRNHLWIIARDCIELSSCLLGPCSLLASQAWRKTPRQFGSWGLVGLWFGLVAWIVVGFVIFLQYQSVQLSRSAEKSLKDGNVEQALAEARSSATRWRRNYYARKLTASILQVQGNTNEAINELSSIIVGVDIVSAYDPGEASIWLADCYEKRAELYDAVGDAQKAASDKTAAIEMRKARYDLFGFKEDPDHSE